LIASFDALEEIEDIRQKVEEVSEAVEQQEGSEKSSYDNNDLLAQGETCESEDCSCQIGGED